MTSRSDLMRRLAPALLLALAPVSFANAEDGPSSLVARPDHFDMLGDVRQADPPLAGVVVTIPAMAHPGIMEITSLANGRVIIAMGQADDAGTKDMLLSSEAIAQLGLQGATGHRVRIRRTVASPLDAAQLRSGKAAAPRISAPPALLAALNARYDRGERVLTAATPSPDAPMTGRNSPVADAGTAEISVPAYPILAPAPSATSTANSLAATRRDIVPVASPQKNGGRLVIQVAAVSDMSKVGMIRKQLQFIAPVFTETSGTLTRVRLGPFESAQAADQALAGVRSKGYGSARILRLP